MGGFPGLISLQPLGAFCGAKTEVIENWSSFNFHELIMPKYSFSLGYKNHPFLGYISIGLNFTRNLRVYWEELC